MSEQNVSDEVVIDEEGDDFDWISIDPGESRDEFDVPFAFLPESERERSLSNSQLGDTSNDHEAYVPRRRVYRETPHRDRTEEAPKENSNYLESVGVLLVTSIVVMGALGALIWARRR